MKKTRFCLFFNVYYIYVVGDMRDYWQERLEGCVNADDIVTCNSSCDTVCLKFKFLYNITTGCFQSRPLLGK